MMKTEKLEKIRAVLRDDMPFTETAHHFNFLNRELRNAFDIVKTGNVSSNQYDPIALSMIEKNADGLILDCGSGKRDTFYPNVVNFEIVPYDSTDVLGVGEMLPFRDNSFDAVFSLAVLEHVKDPFLCASEIARVMKPGAQLYCVVPFLQPQHGYPHHYYNMTMQGVKNLFESELEIDRQEVIASGLPVWSIAFLLRRWAKGLEGETKDAFLKMTVEELMADPLSSLHKPFVTRLNDKTNSDLACTTALFASKPASPISKETLRRKNTWKGGPRAQRRSFWSRLFR